MSTEAYIRDPRFEAHGAAIKWDKNTSAQWYDQRELSYILKEEDWSDVFLICHHAQFDGFILSHHYNVRPAMYGCTLSMARLLLGNNLSVSLEAVRKNFGLNPKSTPYGLFRNKRWTELTDSVRQQIAEGAIDEVESIWKIFGLLMQSGFPPAELDVIDSVIRMFVDPVLELDSAMLAQLWESEAQRKINGTEALGISGEELRSADRFCQLLEDEGIEIEYKNGKNHPIPAIAKNDPFMRDFLREHPSERVRALAEARLAEKSTLLQTRAETLGWVASRGPAPVYLHYSGAGTLRPSGGDGCNWLNFKRGSPIRRAIKAPQGHYLAPVDASQIECVAHGQIVLTDNGPKAIQDVTLADRVWDGIEWVTHEGVVFKGTREVITYQNVTCTPDHIVFVRSGCGEEKMEMRVAAALGRDLVKADSPSSVCKTSVREPFVRRLQNLWSARDKIQIQVSARSSDLGYEKLTTSRLYRSRNRSQRQRRSLRTWKFAIIIAARECQQSLYNILDSSWCRQACNAGFQASLPGMRVWARSNQSVSRKGIDRRTNYRALQTSLQKNDFSQAAPSWNWTRTGFETSKETIPQQAKVYDIVNAGPRHRFAVSGVIVSNCRVLHYLAGGPNDPVIEQFRNNHDPYVDLASFYYQETIYKPKADDPRYDEMTAKRGMGKQGRLMCGYGASGKQFKATAASGQYGPRVDMTIEEANRFVEIYRTSNPSICAPRTGYWAQCERILARLAGGEPMKFGPMLVKDHRIYIEGAPMIYDTIEYHTPGPNEKNPKTGWRVKKRDGWRFIWGSKLTQNICEGVSRMIVSQAMIRIKKKYGIRTLNWPYDELLLLIPADGREEQTLELCKAEMVVEPSWLPGIPLSCDGSLGSRYEK
jgi:hypothetical protein